jgi:predicted outer membrane repeat protein
MDRVWRGKHQNYFALKLIGLSLSALLCSIVLFSLTSPVYAAMLSVNDALGVDSGDCTITPCKTIGYALTQANNGDSIIIASGHYTENLDVNKNITLSGAGASTTFISGKNVFNRVIWVRSFSSVTISGVTIQKGIGGINNSGVLTLANSIVFSNTLEMGNCGGVGNNGVAVIINSTIKDNQAVHAGGICNYGALEIYNSEVIGNLGDQTGAIENSGVMTITNSQINGNISRVSVAGAILNYGTMAISDTVIQQNSADSYGGGIYSLGKGVLHNVWFESNRGLAGGALCNAGTLTIDGSTLISNTAWHGGGIFSGDPMTMTNTTIANNSARYYGGGVANGGVLTIINSTINDNQSLTGGGIYSSRFSTLTVSASAIISNTATGTGAGITISGTGAITNVTISGNVAQSFAGGIENGGRITLTNVTINNNRVIASNGKAASIFSGGFPDSFIRMMNTIVATNGQIQNCRVESGLGIISAGYNLSNDATCSLTANKDRMNTNPLLDPLANNGGTTLTHALTPNSPAINAGNQVGCPSEDQRGFLRPHGARCDIGAFEFQGAFPFEYRLPQIFRVE